MFVKNSDGKVAVLIVYVDDIVFIGNHEREINRIKGVLSKEFEMKDVGPLKYFMAMEVARHMWDLSFSKKICLNLLKKTVMLGLQTS